MRSKTTRWTFFLFLLGGLVAGSAAGYYAANIEWLSWLGNGQQFGLTPPAHLALGFLSLTFGFTFHFNVGGVVGMGLAALLYKWRR